MLVVAASRLVVLSSDDGGVDSIRGRRACAWGGGVVAREALALEQIAGQRGARQVYRRGIVLEMVKGDFRGG